MARGIMIWLGLLLICGWTMGAAAMSPFLAWRDWVYIAAGFAGVLGSLALIFQPLLATGALPGLHGRLGRRVHHGLGLILVLAVAAHVIGLWITSPPDVVDALLFLSPTPFSAWGVVAMWAIFATAGLAIVRMRLGLRPRTWRIAHKSLAAIIAVGTVIHALLIEGTMGQASKLVVCTLILVVSTTILLDLPSRMRARTRRAKQAKIRKTGRPEKTSWR